MKFAKLITIGLLLGVLILIVTLSRSKNDGFIQPQNEVVQQTKQHSRADDPSYADELKGMAVLLAEVKEERKAMQAQIDTLNAKLDDAGISGNERLKKNVQELEVKLKKQSEDFQKNLAQKDRELRNIFKGLTDSDVQKKVADALNTFKNDITELENRLGIQSQEFQKQLAEKEAILRTSLSGLTEGDVQERIEKALNQFKNDIKTMAEAKDETKAPPPKTPSIDDLIANRDKVKQEIPPVVTPPVTTTPSISAEELLKNAKNKIGESMGQKTSPTQMAPDGNVSIRPYGTAEADPKATGTGIGNLLNFNAPNVNPLKLVPNEGPFQANVAGREKAAPIPIYTIPDTSTLVVNTMMTPLIGRVPGTKGDVADPFRFKFITGAENLATNGHRIPGIDNIVWTGFAIGVRDQSCVRAYVDTVTYTFQDGRIQTITSGKGSGTGAASVLGYLTDPWGKPCIQGQYFSNASQYLQGRGLAAFTAAIAEGIAQADVTNTTSDSGVTTSNVTGNTGRYIAATGLAGTARELSDYVKERQAGAFDVIYVPSGMQIQLFVEQQINIDYDPNGRKISYDYSGSNAAPKANLD